MSADSEIIRRPIDIPSAFAEPFERHAKVIGAFAARRVGADAAQDILNETFLVAFRHRRDFDTSWDSARPWLFGIASRLLGKHRGKEAAQSRAFGAYADLPRAPGGVVAIIDRHAVRTASVLAGVALVAAALAACATPPEASVSTLPTTTSPGPSNASPTTSSPAPSSAALSPSSSPSEDAGTALVLPGACEDIYSDAMFAHLTTTAPPLNDPGHTMPSTELAAGREVLDAAPTLRCTWGGASEYGLSTNVTFVDAGQSASIEQAAVEAGMTCKPHAEGTICRIRQDRFVDGELYATDGETHYFRDNGWVATHWINFAPEGYTEDIVATLWAIIVPTG